MLLKGGGTSRASQGLFVTTYPKPANSQPLDVREAQEQLVNAESIVEALSQASQAHQAESLDEGHDALKTFTDSTQNSLQGMQSGGVTAGGGTGSANAFKKPVMLVASPASIALSTQESLHVSSDQHTNLVSGQSTFVASGKSLVVSVAEKISLFVQNAGMKLFAGKGKVEIQAHSDNIEITAQKTVKVLSSTENIEVAAHQEILLTSGGAYIRLKGGNIEIHAPGRIDIKGAQHAFAGPTQIDYPLPLAPTSINKAALLYQYHDDSPVQGAQFTIHYENGGTYSGTTDSKGVADLSNAPQGTGRIELGEDSRPYELKATEHNPAFKSDWDDHDMQASLERMQGGQA